MLVTTWGFKSPLAHTTQALGFRGPFVYVGQDGPMTDLDAHPLLAGLRDDEVRQWSRSNGDFDEEVTVFEEVEAFLLDGELVVRARTDLDMLSFYWDTDPARIDHDAEHIWGFLESQPGVIVDREAYRWEQFDIWVDVSPGTLEAPIESIYDLLDLVEAHPDGAAFAELLDVRPGGEVIAFWDDLRAYLSARRAAVDGAADAGPA